MASITWRLCSSASVGHSDGKASGQEQNTDVETGAERAQGWDTASQASSGQNTRVKRILIQCSSRLRMDLKMPAFASCERGT